MALHPNRLSNLTNDTPPPLIVHVIDRLSVGGMENGLVNIINNSPNGEFKHAIVCLTDADDFRERLAQPIEVVELHKRPGKDFGVYLRLWRCLRRLRPALVHSRNLSAVDTPIVAFLAGVRARIHSEHGRDTFDLHGTNRKYNALRRLVAPFVTRYITVSKDLANWLNSSVGVPRNKISQIYNGVDQSKFQPAASDETTTVFSIGHVGRFETVKDQATLARAFVELVALDPAASVQLTMVGDGSRLDEVKQIIIDANLLDRADFTGSRNDVNELLRTFGVFVLPSISEGISNTIIEAMATGLPVVATNVGGNPELVVDGETGFLVPPGDATAMAQALHRYVNDAELRSVHSRAARARADELYSMTSMMDGYYTLYRDVVQATGSA